MTKLLVKHFVQVFLIPSAGVTLAWFGHIATEVQPEWSLTIWGAVALATTAAAEILVRSVERFITLSCVSVLLVGFTLGIPVYFFTIGFPVKVHGVVDHGGVLIALFMAAAFTALWRLYRSGHTALDVIESAGNLPKGSLSKIIERGDSEG